MAGVKGKGGKKGRSGRKVKAFTLLKQRIEAEKQDDAEYAFALYAAVMRDETQPIELRLDCSDWVSNRVLGKPKERQEISGDLGIKAYVSISPDMWDEQNDETTK